MSTYKLSAILLFLTAGIRMFIAEAVTNDVLLLIIVGWFLIVKELLQKKENSDGN